MHRLLVLALAVGLTACGSGHACPDPSATGTIRFARGATLTVRFASTDAERAKGLMGVKDLPPDEGMAFEFDAPTRARFWMKDTLIPLSVAFVRDSEVVSLREMMPCAADPCATYGSSAPYTLAIEANAGWFADHGIEEGDRVGAVTGPVCA
jgi:uncharacterized protein